MKSEKGFSLAEVLVAIMLLGIVGTAFLSGLATASRAICIADERATAESLARTHMEYVRSQDYSSAPWDYTLTSSQRERGDPERPTWWDADNPPLLSSDYDGYTVSVSVEGLIQAGVDNSIQKIIVVIYFPSYDTEHLNKQITLEGYRAMQ